MSHEVTSSNSHAVLISEIAEMRRLLWLMIAVGKQIVHLLPATERTQLLKEMMAAEKHLSGGIHG